MFMCYLKRAGEDRIGSHLVLHISGKEVRETQPKEEGIKDRTLEDNGE